jgi:menaquinone-dependent protoporphyrinogen oxidase
MKVLVTAASMHGATDEIAHAIGAVLSSAGIEVDVRPPADVARIEPYDGIVIGSGVYAGHWLEPAKSFVRRHVVALGTRPVWLFSSGPLGERAKPTAEPVDVSAIREATHAIEHRIFPGKLLRRRLGLAERAIVAVVRAPDGDFRPWDDVCDWAWSIARSLNPQAAQTPAPAASLP